MRRAAAVFVLCLMFAGDAFAFDSEAGPYTPGSEPDALGAFDCLGVVSDAQQLPNGISGTAAQDDVCYPFLAESVDNFVGDGNSLIGVGWWGLDLLDEMDAFVVSILADDGGVPGEVLFTETLTEFNPTAGEPNGFCANFAEEFEKVDGVTYWLNIYAVYCFPPQFFWATADGDGTQGWFRSDFLGFPDWVPMDVANPGSPYELAFIQYNREGSTPLEETSWAGVKEQYR